jgi:hypothetical protein
MSLYGGRGIDTQVERRLISYKPLLQYINEYVHSDVMSAPEEYFPSEDIISFAEFSPSACLVEVNTAEDLIDKTIALIEERLKNNVVSILEEDVSPESLSHIKSFCGSNSISFQDFKRAVSSSEVTPESRSVISAYERYHSNINGRIEALLYRRMYSEKKEISAVGNSVSTYVASLLDPKSSLIFSTSDSRLDLPKLNPIKKMSLQEIQEKEKEFTKRWIQIDKEKKETEKRLQELSSEVEISRDPDVHREFRDLKKKHNALLEEEREYNLNPLASTTRAYYQRAASSSSLSERTINLMMATVSDSFHGLLGYMIKKIVRLQGDTFNQEDFRALVQESIDFCKTMQEALKMFAIGVSIKTISLSDIISSAAESIVSSMIPTLLRLVSDLRISMSKPIFNWLEDLRLSDPDIDFLPVNKLANILLNSIEQIEIQFRTIITDFYRISEGQNKNGIAFLDLLEDKKWVYDLNLVLNETIKSLESIKQIPNVQEFVLDKWITNLISENEWDLRWDQESETFTKVTSVLSKY